MMIRLSPALIALTVLAVIHAIDLNRSLDANDGHLVYAMDDTYIHMSIAKHFAQSGIWGITSDGFSSSSSSPLWTFLLSSIYFVFGINDLTPLALNIIFVAALLLLSNDVLIRHDTPLPLRIIILLLMVLFVPLRNNLLLGLEHTLHALLVLAFLAAVSMVLSDKSPLKTQKMGLLFALALLVGLVRYEGLLAVVVVCGLFALRGRWITGILLGLVAGIPLLIYGLIALSHDWYLLPNSILMKSENSSLPENYHLLELIRYIFGTLGAIVRSPFIFSAIVPPLFIYSVRLLREKRAFLLSPAGLFMAGFLLLVTLHARLVSSPAAFFRYQSYLLVLGLLAWGIGLAPLFTPRHGRLLLISAFTLIPAAVSAGFIIRQQPIVTATTNIYHQHWHLAHFLDAHYGGERIAIHDIGAMNFYADIRSVDLLGLGSIEVARLHLADTYDTQAIERLSSEQGVSIAVLNQGFLDDFGGMPSGWIVVETWYVPNSVVLGDDTVAFIALSEGDADELRLSLDEYSANLPAEVVRSPLFEE